MIRLLADENIPLESVRLLRVAGYDVSAIAELTPTIADDVVLALARAEQRILLTFDRDLGELLFRRASPAPPGAVFFRFVPRSPDVVAKLIRTLIEDVDLPLVGRFTVVSDEGERSVRQRPMPGVKLDE